MIPDLHRHLDGSLRPSTVAELADKFRVPVPGDLRFHPRMGLKEALARFEFTLSLLQHPAEVSRVASEICEDAAADGVGVLEIRFAPMLHKGASPEAIVDAALEGVAGRAGLILCGLHDEDPAIMDKLVDIAIPRLGVVGIDLAGSTSKNTRMANYAGAFTRAMEHGIGRTVHAGEGGPATEIRDAILYLHAQRIGHGVTLLDCPEALDLAIQRQVTFEVCLTSNVHTGILRDVSDHPLQEWGDCGMTRFCICPDNTLFSDTTSSKEYDHLRALFDHYWFDATVASMKCGDEAAFRR